MTKPRSRIAMIVPVPVPEAALSSFAAQIPESLAGQTDIEFSCAERGGATLDSYYEGALADFYCLKAGIEAAQRGCDAVCINSMSDSGVTALRSRLNIPVIGTAQSTYLAACLLGKRFSILSMWHRWSWLYEKVIAEQGLGHRLASIRSIDVPPDTEDLLQGKEDFVFPLLESAARIAVEEDGADVLIIGSTTMHQSHAFLEKTIDVPVLNPGLVAFKTCELLLALDLSHSKASFIQPQAHSDNNLASGADLA
ncbi:hydrogenase expression protein HupH [Parasphingopyxis algicola]|uniref:aspartate/glutamate racemase family protein n=1 Tax=Parasphingopyxis algicola TaxID=2026624 RepID=UPI001C40B298|nr:aspartate/glutamate racemase family protein [Parasphingopyxis algicola]QLC25060.1 hydrogenase expression protein HupH [Parasphingopyxis algicola]